MNDKIIEFVINATIFEIQDDPTILKRVKKDKLLNAAWNRLKNAGFLVTCTRCGGTGHYSFNQRDGTRCFKCAGSKWMVPRMNKKWKEAVQSYDWRQLLKNN